MNYISTREKKHLYECIKRVWPNEGEKDEKGRAIRCSLSDETLAKLDCIANFYQACFTDLSLYEIKELVLQLLNWRYETQPRGLNNEI